MAPFYVSTVDGNDSYNGEYPTFQGGSDGPWLTIGKIQSTLTGDQSDTIVYLNRENTWREQLQLKGYGTSGHPFIIGAYGSGADPLIMGSTLITGWEDQGGNIWRAACAGEPGGGDGNGPVFFINTNGDGKVHWGAMDGTPDAEYDWYWDSNFLYCYSPADPDTRYDSVEAATRFNAIQTDNGTDYVTVQDIEACYTARQTFGDDYAADYNIRQRCHVHHSGPESGAGTDWASDNIYWEGAGWTIANNICHNAASHNIQHYDTSSSDGDTIEYNICYDACHASIDCKHIGPTGETNNQIVRYNFVYSTDDYPWPAATDAAIYFLADEASNGLSDSAIYGNIVVNFWTYGIYLAYNCDNINVYNNTVYGRHPNSDDDGIGINLFGPTSGSCPTNVNIKNNIVAGSMGTANGRGIDIYWPQSISGAGVIDYNCYYITTGYYAWYNEATDVYEAGDWETWKTDTNCDTNSLWNVDPKLVNPGTNTDTDYKLASGSPCRDTGTNVGLTEDYWGTTVPKHGAEDIGAHEYIWGCERFVG